MKVEWSCTSLFWGDKAFCNKCIRENMLVIQELQLSNDFRQFTGCSRVKMSCRSDLILWGDWKANQTWPQLGSCERQVCLQEQQEEENGGRSELQVTQFQDFLDFPCFERLPIYDVVAGKKLSRVKMDICCGWKDVTLRVSKKGNDAIRNTWNLECAYHQSAQTVWNWAETKETRWHSFKTGPMIFWKPLK